MAGECSLLDKLQETLWFLLMDQSTCTISESCTNHCRFGDQLGCVKHSLCILNCVTAVEKSTHPYCSYYIYHRVLNVIIWVI